MPFDLVILDLTLPEETVDKISKYFTLQAVYKLKQ